MNIAQLGVLMDTANFKKGVDEVVEGAKTMGGAAMSLSTLFKGSVFAGVGIEIGEKTVDQVIKAMEAIGRLVVEVANARARYDELGAVMDVMGRRAGTNNAALSGYEQALKRTGLSAIESREALVKMMQSQLDLAQSAQLAKAAADVGVTAQISSGDALQRMMRGIQTGQTQMLRTMGLTVNFEDGYKKLAKSLNTTTAELSDQQKMQVRLNTVMAEAAKVQGAYNASLTTASALLKSTESDTSDLQVVVGEVFQPAYITLVELYASALRGLVEWVKENIDVIKSMADTLGDLATAFVTIIRVIGNVIMQFVELTRAAFNAAGVVASAINVMTSVPGSEKQTQYLLTMNERYTDLQSNVKEVTRLMKEEQRVQAEGQALIKYGKQALSREGEDFARRQQLAGSTNPFANLSGITEPAGSLRVAGAGNPFDTMAPGVMATVNALRLIPPAAKASGDEVKEMSKQLKAAMNSAQSFLDSLKEPDMFRAFETGLKKQSEALKEAGGNVKAFTDEAERLFKAKLDREFWEGMWEGMEKVRQASSKLRSAAEELAGKDVERTLALRRAAEAQAIYLAQTGAIVDEELTLEKVLQTVTATYRTMTVAQIEEATQRTLAASASVKAIDEEIVALKEKNAFLSLSRREQAEQAETQRKLASMDERVSIFKSLTAQGIDPLTAMSRANQLMSERNEQQRLLNKSTNDWAGALLNVLQLAGGIANIFGNMPGIMQKVLGGIGTMAGAVKSMQGIQGNLYDAAGNKTGTGDVSFGAAISGKGGAGAFMSAASSMFAFVGAAVEVGRAIMSVMDAENQRVNAMKKADEAYTASIKSFNEATADLSRGNVEGMVVGLKRELGKSLQEGLFAGTQNFGWKDFDPTRDFNLETIRKLSTTLPADARALEGGESAAQGAEKVAKGMQEAWDALVERLKVIAKDALADINKAYNTAFGNETANALIAAEEVRDSRMADLKTLLDYGALTAEDYAAAVTKVSDTYTKSIENINAAEAERQRQIANSNAEFDARLMDATGNTREARDLRQQIKDENELTEARLKGLDVTKLLAAQEAEAAQRAAQEARDVADATQSLIIRAIAAGGNTLGAQLMRAEAERLAEIESWEQKFGKDSPLIEWLKAVQQAEEDAVTAAMRRGFTDDVRGLQRGLVTDTVAGATLDALDLRTQAEEKYGELLSNNIITMAEYNEAMGLVNQTADNMIALAEEARKQQHTDFTVNLAGRRAALNPDDPALRKTAFDMAWDAEYQRLLDDGKRLFEAGTIGQQELDDWTNVINEQFSPAARDAAFATQEAADAFANAASIMQDNVNTLQQQWDVFGTDAVQQAKDLGDLYGFAGKSLDEVRGMFTKMVAGVELTPAQKQLNQQITDYLRAVGAGEAWQMSEAEKALDAANKSDAAKEGRKLELGSVTSITHDDALRLIDISFTQLSVLRQIERNTRPKPGAAGVQVMVQGGSYAGDPSAVAQGVADAVTPLVDNALGRQAGQEKRLTGDATL